MTITPKWQVAIYAILPRIAQSPWGRVSLGPVCDGYDSNNPFGDDQLRGVIPHLNRFPKFTTLHITGTAVTDAGTLHLQKLNNLEVLYIDRTQLSDTGLERLAEIRTLKTLDVRGTAVTPEGVAKLQTALPACKVLWEQP